MTEEIVLSTIIACQQTKIEIITDTDNQITPAINYSSANTLRAAIDNFNSCRIYMALMDGEPVELYVAGSIIKDITSRLRQAWLRPQSYAYSGKRLASQLAVLIQALDKYLPVVVGDSYIETKPAQAFVPKDFVLVHFAIDGLYFYDSESLNRLYPEDTYMEEDKCVLSLNNASHVTVVDQSFGALILAAEWLGLSAAPTAQVRQPRFYIPTAKELREIDNKYTTAFVNALFKMREGKIPPEVIDPVTELAASRLAYTAGKKLSKLP
jgi:hypothetical protein